MKTKTTYQLINNVVGQLNGINRMIEEEKDCIEIVAQMKAAKSAVGSFMDKYIQSNADSCIGNLKDKDKKLLSKLIKELSNK